MSLYLCCDCGGSKTSAVIVDASGVVLGRAFGGPSNFAYLTLEGYLSAVQLTVSDALKTCVTPTSIEPVPLPPNEPLFAAAWFGVSGVDSPSAVAAITPELSKLLAIPVGPRLIVANDTHLLAAPVRMHDDVSHAVGVIGGTGSIAVTFKQTESNEIQELGRIGGWGWILGDEGGGFHVGREAVRQVLEANDRASVCANPNVDGPLVRRILDHFSVTSILEVLTAVHLTDPTAGLKSGPPHAAMPREKRLSSISPLVFAAAYDDNDPLALKVLQTCAGILADEIAALLGDPTPEFPKLVPAKDTVISFGGSLVGIEKYRKIIIGELEKRGHAFAHIHFVDDAAFTGAQGLAASFS
ncbi:hypothetical protein DL96DRAFT_1463373 [Flagelloscypha sp. PMI_526]|nr:hypothetical protein DL96DRAFT_1463373 [Flagelloscypha sp. PMI_526]